MLGLLNTVLSKGNTLLTYVKDGLVMANRFLTPPKLTFPVDASAEFNGTSDYIDLGTKSFIDETGFTISFWQYANDTGEGYIFSTGYNNANSLLVVNDAFSANTYVLYYNGSTAISSTYVSHPVKDWVHFSLVYDGTTLKTYKDGSEAASQSFNITAIDEGAYQIGWASQRNKGTAYFDGNLANVAIWNRALSSDEINSVMWKTYEQVSTTESNGLQAWYKLSADEVLSGDSTATLTTYANANKLTFEAPACVQTALNGLPDITDARLYSANYDIRVSADGGNVESLSCVETELNAIL